MKTIVICPITIVSGSYGFYFLIGLLFVLMFYPLVLLTSRFFYKPFQLFNFCIYTLFIGETDLSTESATFDYWLFVFFQ